MLRRSVPRPPFTSIHRLPKPSPRSSRLCFPSTRMHGVELARDQPPPPGGPEIAPGRTPPEFVRPPSYRAGAAPSEIPRASPPALDPIPQEVPSDPPPGSPGPNPGPEIPRPPLPSPPTPDIPIPKPAVPPPQRPVVVPPRPPSIDPPPTAPPDIVPPPSLPPEITPPGGPFGGGIRVLKGLVRADSGSGASSSVFASG